MSLYILSIFKIIFNKKEKNINDKGLENKKILMVSLSNPNSLNNNMKPVVPKSKARALVTPNRMRI